MTSDHGAIRSTGGPSGHGTGRSSGRTRGGAVRLLIEGATYLPRGMLTFARMRDSWVLGVLPAVLAAALAGAVLLLLLVWADDLVRFLTPFADGWEDGPRDLFRALIGILLVLGYLVGVVFTFVALALAIGQPFYERISERVGRRLGDPAPAADDQPAWRSVPASVADSARLLALTAAFGIPLFFLGFVPVIGQTVVPALGACVSGFFLAGELLSVPLERRGLRQRDRLTLLRRHLPMSIGFGAAAFLVLLVPVVNLLAMPGAVAGGTLLARRMLPPAPPTPAEEGEPPPAVQPDR